MAEKKVRKFKKISEYGRQLQEKQELKKIYGIREKQFRRYVEMATKMQGSASENLLKILELRLDNVIFRSGLAMTRPHARQLVNHRFFQVNGKTTNIPSLLVKPNDSIEPSKKEIFGHIKLNTSSWFLSDNESKRITISHLPSRAEIDTPINENLVIQFYSR